MKIDEVGRFEHAGVLVRELRFGETAGYLAGAESTSGVVIAHGGNAPGKHLFLDEAVEIARDGHLVLAADTSMPPLGDLAADERGFTAALLVQRQSLDVLEGEGATRLGFYGHSFGGTQAAILSATEPRLAAIVVAAMGTGISDYARSQGHDEAYFEAIDRFDPIHYASVPGRRHILFQAGRLDDVIPLASVRALYDAAAEPKSWREYDCGHGITVDPAAHRDRLAFFDETLAVP